MTLAPLIPLAVSGVQRALYLELIGRCQWWADDVGVFSSATSPSLWITGTRSVYVELDDAFNRHHPWTGTTAIANNAKHTAVIMSVSSML